MTFKKKSKIKIIAFIFFNGLLKFFKKFVI